MNTWPHSRWDCTPVLQELGPRPGAVLRVSVLVNLPPADVPQMFWEHLCVFGDPGGEGQVLWKSVGTGGEVGSYH